MSIRTATGDDLSDITALLESHHLPTAGLAAPLDGFLVAEEDGEVIGVIGLERFDRFGLLRSAAVAESRRGQSVGRDLVERLLSHASTEGVSAVYLLTTTAERYFQKFGFEQVARDDVPEPVRRSVEFTVACPASAVVMVRAQA